MANSKEMEDTQALRLLDCPSQPAPSPVFKVGEQHNRLLSGPRYSSNLGFCKQSPWSGSDAQQAWALRTGVRKYRAQPCSVLSQEAEVLV